MTSRQVFEEAIVKAMEPILENDLSRVNLGPYGFIMYTGMKSSNGTHGFVAQWVFYAPEEIWRADDWEKDGPSLFYASVPGTAAGPFRRGNCFDTSEQLFPKQITSREQLNELALDGLRRLFDSIIEAKPAWMMRMLANDEIMGLPLSGQQAE